MVYTASTFFAILAATSIGSTIVNAQLLPAGVGSTTTLKLNTRGDILKRITGVAKGSSNGRRSLNRRQGGPSTTPEPPVNALCIAPDLDGLSFQDQALTQHNFYRAQHDIVDLTWNPTVAGYAQELSDTCVYGHSNAQGDGNYGQNIGAGYSPDQISDLIDAFMAEQPLYPGPYGEDNIDISNFEDWGHYSQIVWTDTTSVGCAVTFCPNGLENFSANPSYFTVCNYSPPGNFVGEWSRVAAPIVDCST